MSIYRDKLLLKEKEILEQLKISEELEKPVSLGESIGRLTRMDAMLRQHQALHIREINEKSLIFIRNAISRIDRGIYGICNKCKSVIDNERLEVMPEALICTSCMRSIRNTP